MSQATLGTTQKLIKDIVAGLVVFLVALPLCLGVANASRAEGLPETLNATILSGIIAGIIGGLIVGLISNSNTSVSGPAAGLTAVVALQIAKVGSFQGFLVAVVLAGLIQIGLGCLRAGSLAVFFPSSVIKGLLTAIGVILILKQLPHLVGHDRDPNGAMSLFPPDQRNMFTELIDTLDDFDMGAAVIGLSSLAFLLLWEQRKCLKTSIVPSALVVVLWGIACVVLFDSLGGRWPITADHKVRLPDPKSWEEFVNQLTRPNFSALQSRAVYIAALVLAIVASLETLLNIEAVDKLDPRQRRTNPSRELVAQGIGNSVSGLLGGLPVTSVIVRSSANIHAGAQTKLAAILHGLFLLLCVAFIPHMLNKIPLACLAAILLLTGYKLASPKILKQMIAHGSERYLPYFATVIGIVMTDLLLGIIIGLGVASAFIVRSNLRRPSRVIHERHRSGEVIRIELGNQVSFLNRANLIRLLESIPDGGHVLIDANQTDYIDPDILELLEDFRLEMAPARGINVSLVGFQDRYKFEDCILAVDYTTRELPSQISPREVLAILVDGNQRFQSGKLVQRNFSRALTGTDQAQFPLAVVLSCIDLWTPSERIFDLGVGDIFSIRMAGNIAPDKVLGSLEYACVVARSKLIVVLGHTHCRAVTAAVDLRVRGISARDAMRCDYLDALIGEIQEALPAEAIPSQSPPHPAYVDQTAEANVRRSTEKIQEKSQALHRLIEAGALAIVGGIYDVRSGAVRWIVLPTGWQLS